MALWCFLIWISLADVLFPCRDWLPLSEWLTVYKCIFQNVLWPSTVFLQDVNCRQYYKGNPEANAKAYSGLAVSLGTGGENTAVSSVITPPVLTTSSVTETTTLLTVEPKVVFLNECITHSSVQCFGDTWLHFILLLRLAQYNKPPSFMGDCFSN